MDWKELPGNYDDFQHEIVHVKNATVVVKSFVDEYIQYEVNNSMDYSYKPKTEKTQIQYKNGLTHLYQKHSKIFDNMDSFKQPGTDSFLRQFADNLMRTLEGRVKQADIYTEKLTSDSQFKLDDAFSQLQGQVAQQ